MKRIALAGATIALLTGTAVTAQIAAPNTAKGLGTTTVPQQQLNVPVEQRTGKSTAMDAKGNPANAMDKDIGGGSDSGSTSKHGSSGGDKGTANGGGGNGNSNNGGGNSGGGAADGNNKPSGGNDNDNGGGGDPKERVMAKSGMNAVVNNASIGTVASGPAIDAVQQKQQQTKQQKMNSAMPQ